MSEVLLSTRDAAAYLGVGTTSIKRWADDGALPCVRTVGGHRRFRMSDLERLRKPSGPEASTSTEFGLPYALETMTRDEIDALEVGVIQLSDDGSIMLFSKAESRLTGLQASQVEGRNMFSEVAPCMNNSLVMGRVSAGVKAGELDETFDYTFTYRMKPTAVVLTLYRKMGGTSTWLVVRQAQRLNSYLV